MKKTLALVLVTFSLTMFGCMAPSGGATDSSPEDSDEEAAIAEAQEALEVGTHVKFTGKITGVPFPGAICVGLAGGQFSMAGPNGCVDVFEIKNCQWNSQSNECTCDCVVVSSSC